MREIVIRNWCDVCNESGERSEATVIFTVAISESGTHGGVARVLETCDVHAKTVRDVQRLALERGVRPQELMQKTTPPVRPPAGPSANTQCPLCDLGVAKSSLLTHLRGRHGAQAVPQPDVCPECGYTNEYPQGMGTHRARAHGISAITETLATIGRAPDGSLLPEPSATRTRRTAAKPS